MKSYICRRCNRPLKDKKSIENGIGPICAAKERVEGEQTSMFGNGQYYGLPFDEKTRDIVCKRDPEKDFNCSFNFKHSEKYHSPTGMEWGYGGSGPADFALNALMMFVPRDIAWKHHQQFKWDFVCGLPRLGGTIKGIKIRNWLKLAGVDPKVVK